MAIFNRTDTTDTATAEPTDTTATDTTTDDQALVQEIHGDLERNAITINDVYTELDRPQVGEK